MGYNYRLSDIQAAVGVAQFKKLDLLLQDRLRCASYYLDHLESLPNIICPLRSGICGHTYQSFVIRMPNSKIRNHIIDIFTKNGIQSRFGTTAVHQTQYYAEKYKIDPMDFPMSSLCEACTITLPIYFGMSNSEQDMIINILKENSRY